MKKHSAPLLWIVPGLLLAGCGTTPKPLPPQAKAHIHTLQFGVVRLYPGMVWQLNNPGGGTPRESLAIQSLKQKQVSCVAYISEFGSLIQANIMGTLKSPTSLTLTGTVSESTATGSIKTLPIHLTLVPVRPHTLWVTQTIHGDPVNTFSQIPFHETSR